MSDCLWFVRTCPDTYELVLLYTFRLEGEGSLEEAAVCYREALADDPDQTSAKTRLMVVSKQLERKVGLYWNVVVPVRS